MVERAARAGQVEERMGGELRQRGGLSGLGAPGDAQGVVGQDLVTDPQSQRPRHTVVLGAEDMAELQRIRLHVVHLERPEPASTRATVHGMAAAVERQLQHRAIRQRQRQPALPQPAGPPADEGPHRQLAAQVARQAVVAQDHLGPAALAIGHRHADQAGAVVADGHLDPARPTQGVQIGARTVHPGLKVRARQGLHVVSAPLQSGLLG